MTEEQQKNSNEGMIVGFLAAMFLLLINIFYDLKFDENFMSSHTIFFSIFVISLGYEGYLNIKKSEVQSTFS
ncbi:hypothetical protein [Paenisporosarcina sp. OV554]|uniref:hypothetical protein n=1 Tax=Paenisporosarcina sp. OV554 TaxID=2135694 RepID=UPI001304B8A0|nr:hypothetical protein [Paenisporosarcina sp. OV554]